MRTVLTTWQSRWLFAIALFLSLRLFLPADETAGETGLLFQPPRDASLLALERIRRESLEPALARFDPESGRAASLEGRFPLAAGPAAGACLEFLAREPDLFGWDPALELRLLTENQGIGTEHLRFQTYLAGIPVAASRVHFHLEVSADGSSRSLVYVNARLPPDSLPAAAIGDFLTPRLASGEAVEIALGAVNPRLLRSEPRSRLEILPHPAPGRLTHLVHLPSLDPRGLFAVRIDARTGEVISSGDLLRPAPTRRDGTGKVFLTNPIVALRDKTLRDEEDSAAAVPPAAYVQVPLRDLDGRGVLAGPYVTTEFTPRAARRVRLEFPLLRDDDGFEEVMIYYHLDSMQRFIQGLGFKNVYNRQISAFANSEPPGIPYTDSQAYYLPDPENPGTGELAFGSGGADLAEDAEVIGHEYGHAVQDSQVPGFGSDFENLETFALGEGWADWLSAVYLSDQSGGYGDDCLGEWAALREPVEPPEEQPECVRRLDSIKHYPQDLIGEPHADGGMWSASLWRIFKLLGREDSLKLVIQSNFFLSTAATFEEAARAVLRADNQLFGGSHREFIEEPFTDRGFFATPLDLTGFFVVKHAPQGRVEARGGSFISKSRMVQPGVIPGGGTPLEVYLNLVHPSPGEVTVSLRSPSGTNVVLIFAGFSFLPNRPVIFGRTLEPTQSMEILSGESISGVWTLRLDNESFADGFLAEWGLRFQSFLRGDVNRDGAVDLPDAFSLLLYQFLGRAVSCPKAGDFDDSGSLTVSDAVGLLRYLFGGGPPPPDPFPDPGSDSTADALPCGAP